MPVPTLISQLSTTPSSNSPSGSESTITNDDYLRTLSAFLAQVRDGVGITPTASITFPAGSASAPSVTFIGDTDTGIYSPGANQVAIASGGSERVQINSFGAMVVRPPTAGAASIPLTASINESGPPVVQLDTGASTLSPYLQFQRNAVIADGLLGSAGIAATLVSDVAVGDVVLRANAGDIRLSVNGGLSSAVRVSNVGFVDFKSYATSTSSYLQFSRFGVGADGIIGSVGTAGALISDAAAGDVVLRGNTRSVRISTDGGASSALVVTTDKRIYGTGLHNNGNVSGTANQYIASQSASPAPASVSNIASLTAHKSKIIRLGNTVMVDGLVTVAATATGSASFAIPLPIPSSLAAFDDLSGQIQDIESSVPQVGTIQCDFTFDRAIVVFTATTTASRLWSYHFAYEVL